jgi:hypothetical protein
MNSPMEKNVVLRTHWKRFIFAWIWPFVLFAVGLFMGHSEHPRLIFFVIFFPVFLACNYVASKPLRDRQLTIGQGIWWIGVMPILIWAVVIFGTFGLARLAGINGNGGN